MKRSILLGCLIVLSLVGVPAAAQAPDYEVNRLEIRDGRVYHNGEMLPADALPEEFDIEGITFTFEYGGPVMPALSLNGRVYALEDGKLVALEEAEVREARAAAVVPVPRTAEEGRSQMEEAYLQTLSERDRALYERLMRERDMEYEVLRLAYRARRTTETDERAQLRDQLHELLSALFELKQENRREEIQQVENLLAAMNQQMQEREVHRAELIRQRLAELLGQP